MTKNSTLDLDPDTDIYSSFEESRSALECSARLPLKVRATSQVLLVVPKNLRPWLDAQLAPILCLRKLMMIFNDKFMRQFVGQPTGVTKLTPDFGSL